jgi:osmotically-inducible protein OsmY
METQRSLLAQSLAALALYTGGAASVSGQDLSRPAAPAQVGPRVATPVAPDASRPEVAVLTAIRSHPLTAPYPISAAWRNGTIVLSGVVGTKQVHDIAVRIAIEAGLPLRDNLIIDTGASHLAAMSATMAVGGSSSLFSQPSSYSPYVYPPPLFGRLDDPFFGYVPPLVSFPPWWRRSVENLPRPRPGQFQENTQPGMAGQSAAQPQFGAPRDARPAIDDAPVKGQVELTVDASGQIFLRGVVASEEAAREILEAARSVPGVRNVQSELQVVPRRAPEGEEPPPPPEPAIRPPAPEPVIKPSSPEPAIKPPSFEPANKSPAPERGLPPAEAPVRPRPVPGPTALDAQGLTRRVKAGLARRPLIAELPVKIRSNDGNVTLSGEVPSAYEAMLVFRTTQQTPGVRDVVDRLEFTIPDEDHPNPLVRKGRPEDLEPYLAAQVRRHIGDLAHVDRVHARGDVIELHGTLLEARDRDRIMAILRSIPLLQGFRLEPDFKAEE